MAANEQYDVLLGAPGSPKGWMLVRPAGRSGAARAWKRYGVRVSPQGSSPDEARFNSAPDEVRFADTWDDFSGGFGYAYRTAAPPNGVHWSENMDTRFAGQAVHCQAMLTFSVNVDDVNRGPGVNFVQLMDAGIAGVPNTPAGAGSILALQGPADPSGPNTLPGQGYAIVPATISTEGSPFQIGHLQVSPSGANFTGRAAMFGSYFYAGTTGTLTRIPRNVSTPEKTGSLSAQMFANAGNRLWRAFGEFDSGRAFMVSSVAADADPFVPANWSATLIVGDGYTGVNDMLGFQESVFLGLPQGLYQGDQSGTFINVTGDLAGAVNRDNFRDLCVHDGQVVGVHVSGIYAYDPNNTSVARVRQIGPVTRSNRSPVKGMARAVRSFGGYLYAGLWTGSQSWLMAGMDTGDGYRWHLMNRLPAVVRVGRMHFDGITAASGGAKPLPTRLWIAGDPSVNFGGLTGTAPLYWQPIPPLNANPLSPGPVFSANYNGSARMVLPRSDRGAPGVLKMYEYAEVWADAFLSGSRYADVYYQIDGGARTLLGRAQSSPVSTLYFTQSNPSFYSGRSIELDVESYDATPGTCQAYRSLVVYGVMRPNQAAVVDAVFHVGDSVPDRRGVPMRPGRTMIDELRSFADPARLGGQALTLIDLAGATQNVVVVGEPVESEFYQDGSRDPEVQVAVKLAVLTASGL